MKAKISIITLGVKNLVKSKKFYAKLGFKANDKYKGIIFFKLQNLTLALFPQKELAEDATVSVKGSGFRSFTLAHNVSSKKKVDAVLAEAKKAGGRIVKFGQDVSWGGYSGYFKDPDGFLWEVAWNPFMDLV
ncbi:MAG: VOC family protein [Patescibacteria group bacterium]|nr:VOC family protein [Patescibacteria group bacterium]